MSNPAPKGPGSQPRPAAEGEVADRPFPRLLSQLMQKRVTGWLVVRDDAGDESRVFLREGAPVHVVRPTDADRLDHVIAEAGLVSPSVLRAVSDSLPPGQRLGEVLVERGLVTEAALADLLKMQMRRKLFRLFHARRGHWSIWVDAHKFGAGSEFVEMRVDPRCLILGGIRQAYDEARLRAELAPLQGRRFRLLRSIPSSLLEAMGFPAGDPTLAAIEGGARTLTDFPTPGVTATEALAVLLALLYADLLEAGITAAPKAVPAAASSARLPVIASAPGKPGGQSSSAASVPPRPSPAPGSGPTATQGGVAHASGGGSPASVPAMGRPPAVASSGSTGRLPIAAAGGSSSRLPVVPAVATSGSAGGPVAGRPGADAGLAAKIEDLLARADGLSHFELLGVPESATAEQVSSAYLARMREFHPDRIAGRGLRDLAVKAAAVVARMNEASGVLLDPVRKAAYLATRSGTAPPPDLARALMSAEESFHKGEVLLRRGDFVHAEAAFAAAATEAPQEPVFRAYAAWAAWQKDATHRDRTVRETLLAVDDVLLARPKFALGQHWKGLLLKHLGDLAAAEAAFRAAVTEDRSLLDAERELRVLEMRRQRAAVAAAAAPPEKAVAVSAARKTGLADKLLKR